MRLHPLAETEPESSGFFLRELHPVDPHSQRSFAHEEEVIALQTAVHPLRDHRSLDPPGPTPWWCADA
jgi:hypothetical protein